MKKTIALLLVLLLIIPLVSCKGGAGEPIDLSDKTIVINENTSKITDPEVPEEAKKSESAEADTHIVLSDVGIEIDGVGADASGSILTITKAGTYELTGNLSNGKIVVDTEDEEKVKIVLNGVDLSSDGCPFVVLSAPKHVTLHLQKGSVNVISDGKTRNTNEQDYNAAIYSKDDLKISGAGMLTVKGNFGRGVNCRDDLTFENGTIVIEAKTHAIEGKDSVTVTGGSLYVTAGTDGIRSDNTEDEEKGNVLIENGTIKIECGDDGIHAENTLTVAGGTIDVTDSYEGLEANQILISGGSTTVYARDDGVNASGGNSSGFGPGGGGGFGPGGGGGHDPRYPKRNDQSAETSGKTPEITISGGYLEVTTPRGDTDGIDSNGNITITGGTVFVKGGSSTGNMSGSVDTDGKITVSGGVVIAFGGICELPSNADSVGIYCQRRTFSSGDYTLADNDGNALLSFTLSESYGGLWITLPTLKTSCKYKLLKNGETCLSWTQKNAWQSVS